ncbi:MAG: PAS domain-containing protein [Alphaproteobacteria bacterium]|nr:PAS domain-containing protein [Alphaproteobacteria bacterium]
MALRSLARKIDTAPPDPTQILAALPESLLVIDINDRICFVNSAAEQLFESGAPTFMGTALRDLLPNDGPLFSLIASVRESGHSVSEYGVTLETPRLPMRFVDIQAAPLSETRDRVLLTFQERSIANKIDRQLTHRNAARSVTAMASMLAHEVKNPLSGIRGAAQLLEPNVTSADRELTRLICDETDRICALVDRMDVFSDSGPLERSAINIHEVMERVRKAAQSGFARHVQITEVYDPSLPFVHGNRDLLIQVFMNLVKNAAEAVPEQGGEIELRTAYQQGVRLAFAGSESRVHLPLVVSVTDNGAGIPDDLRPHLFDPFVSTKRNGNGLGLALVAKVIGDHGGVIEFESEPRRTVFRVYLPVSRERPGKAAGP